MFRGDLTEESQLDSENAYHMDCDNTHRMLVQLRLKHGTRNKLSTILKNEFGSEEGARSFIEFCKDHHVDFQALRE